MMLKIRNKNPDKGISWKLIDNIKEMSYEYLYICEAEGVKENCKESIPSYVIYNYLYNNSTTPSDTDRVCLISVEKNDGTKLLILTDDMIYVLNDEGKTCESVEVCQ